MFFYSIFDFSSNSTSLVASLSFQIAWLYFWDLPISSLAAQCEGTDLLLHGILVLKKISQNVQKSLHFQHCTSIPPLAYVTTVNTSTTQHLKDQEAPTIITVVQTSPAVPQVNQIWRVQLICDVLFSSRGQQALQEPKAAKSLHEAPAQ